MVSETMSMKLKILIEKQFLSTKYFEEMCLLLLFLSSFATDLDVYIIQIIWNFIIIF